MDALMVLLSVVVGVGTPRKGEKRKVLWVGWVVREGVRSANNLGGGGRWCVGESELFKTAVHLDDEGLDPVHELGVCLMAEDEALGEGTEAWEVHVVCVVGGVMRAPIAFRVGGLVGGGGVVGGVDMATHPGDPHGVWAACAHDFVKVNPEVALLVQQPWSLRGGALPSM